MFLHSSLDPEHGALIVNTKVYTIKYLYEIYPPKTYILGDS